MKLTLKCGNDKQTNIPLESSESSVDGKENNKQSREENFTQDVEILCEGIFPPLIVVFRCGIVLVTLFHVLFAAYLSCMNIHSTLTSLPDCVSCSQVSFDVPVGNH